MANYHHLLLFLLLLTSATPNPPPPTTTTTRSSPSPHKQHNRRIHWVRRLLKLGQRPIPFRSMLPLSATLSIPNDAASLPSTQALDPLVLPYHIVPQHLAFSQLLLFKPSSCHPTLLPFNSILVINNSISNFTLDGTPLSHPNLYATDSIVVHGLDSLLDYSVNGSAARVAPPPLPPLGNFNLAGELMFRPRGSGAGCLCTEVWVVFLASFSVLGVVMKGSFPTSEFIICLLVCTHYLIGVFFLKLVLAWHFNLWEKVILEYFH